MSVLEPLGTYLCQQYGRWTGLSFIDSITLSVFDNHLIHCHRMFEGLAEHDKGWMGWFYCFICISWLITVADCRLVV
jgi:hypothetical protein